MMSNFFKSESKYINELEVYSHSHLSSRACDNEDYIKKVI